MKLIIQIPCFNEATSLPITLAALPRSVAGCEQVEWLVIDDGSSDDTAAVARQSGVDHVIRHSTNRGLAAAFMSGLDAATGLGADIIVNTDADNQYDARDIETLVKPIIDGKAEFVIGARPIETTQHFSWLKRRLQSLGSRVVRIASGTNVADAPSGFRAMTRDVALRLNVFNSYTYTLETIIQAGRSNIRVMSVPVRTNPDMRPSRLVKSVGSYVGKSLSTIVRIFATYRPMLFFWLLGGLFTLAGLASGIRFLIYVAIGAGTGHVQSVIFTAMCITLGFLLFMLGFIADLMATNRRLLERIEWRVRRLEVHQLPAQHGAKDAIPTIDAKAALTSEFTDDRG
jgi:glycosyltransferase involved in cell wall biosynthesis